MKYVAGILIVLTLLECQFELGEEDALAVSLKQLTATPKTFDEKLVKVRGFLVIETQPKHGPLVMLYLSQDDARDLVTKNAILVVPSAGMMRSQALDHKYVTVIGKFRAVPGLNGSYGPLIKDIRNFSLSSDE
jgi:hypothetical protein